MTFKSENGISRWGTLTEILPGDSLQVFNESSTAHIDKCFPAQGFYGKPSISDAFKYK